MHINYFLDRGTPNMLEVLNFQDRSLTFTKLYRSLTVIFIFIFKLCKNKNDNV